MGKKSGPKAPPPPDPYKTADAQGEVNKETAIAQANLNRVNQVTPQGTLTYNQIGTNPDGTPQYEQVMQYSPEQQALYEQQNQVAQALGGLAQDNIGRVADAQQDPFSFDGMTEARNVNFNPNTIQTDVGYTPQFQGQIADAGDVVRSAGGDFNETSSAASDAVYNQLASRLDPQYQELEQRMRDRLINSGISENSEAFNREMDRFARQRTDAYSTAANQSILTGLQAQNQGFNQSLNNARLNNDAQAQIFGQNAAQLTAANAAESDQFQSALQSAAFNNQGQQQRFSTDMAGANFNNNLRQREIEEASYLRNLPLNDIAALLGTGGGVQAPTFGPVSQVGMNAPDLMGAVYNSNQIAQNQWMQQQQNRSAGLGSLFGLAGSAAMAFSDVRLKENIKRVGELANGLSTYVFNYIGDTKRQFGVMAQEALNVKPEAVSEVDGYLVVDYGKVYS